jgi:hypothetical protein
MSTGRFVPRTCEPPAPPQALPLQRRTSEATRIPKPAIPRRLSVRTRRMESHMTCKHERRARARRTLPPVYELAALSVFGFCLAHGLSRSTFYRMLEGGNGPRIMKCGRRTLISIEGAQSWRRARERAALGAARSCPRPQVRRRAGR